MISRIQLRNFYSHQDTEIDLSASSLISVAGENGHGKSALLEAVLYALYGYARVPTADLIRNGSDGRMKVAIEMRLADGLYAIARSRTAGVTSGRTVVASGTEEIARGRAAQAVIDGIIGQDQQSFLLTSYFGAGENDSLFRARPSERLKTLHDQQIIDVSLYAKAHARINTLLSVKRQKADELRGRIAAQEELSESIEEIDEKLEEEREKAEALRAELAGIADDVRRVEESIVLKGEIDALEKNEAQTAKQLTTWRSKASDAQRERDAAQFEMVELQGERKKLKGEYDDDRMTQLLKRSMQHEVEINLKKSALDTKDSADCPLCDEPLKKSSRSKWGIDIKRLTKEREEFENERHELHSKLVRLRELKRLISVTQNSIESARRTYREARAQVKPLKEALDKCSAKIVEKRDQLLQYQDLKANKILAERDGVQQGLKSVEQAINTLEFARQRAEETMQSIADDKKKARKVKSDLFVGSVVSEAFGKYGIPYRLMTKLLAMVGERATEVYQWFGDEEVSVEQVEERGRPGVEFFVLDDHGKRSYKQLSTGQQTFLLFSVRLALAQIASMKAQSASDILVLDEIASNLSEEQRENFASFIHQVLSKQYNQIFVVSHAPMSDIFDTVLQVSMTDGVSEVLVA